MDRNEDQHGHGPRGSLAALALSALGVVYGDIGTSPLYAVKECFNPEFGLDPSVDNVVGITSLILWSLILVVVVKYLVIVMRADNKGEGGVLALLALISQGSFAGGKGEGGQPGSGKSSRLFLPAVFAALIGTALLGADGTITPAISVLSAVEGLKVATPAFDRFVLPIAIVIIIGLFLIQKRGTARISSFFGPLMVTWFISIAAIAVPAIIRQPGIFAAFNPARGVWLLTHHGWHGFLVLGAVVLCVTGAEALYADMGHFGRRSISVAWYSLVMPSLVINYLGQGAHLMVEPSAAANPFYALAPGVLIYPMVAIATLAAIIASQALISGSFSLAQQAIQLGYSPRLTIVHTSEMAKGQIFVPEINALLLVTCVGLVLAFRTSTNLAGAYGIAVVGTMTITSFLMYIVAVNRFGWKKRWAALMLVGFLATDLPFLAANIPKIAHGGWFPILICIGVFSIMTTWKRGRGALVRRMVRSFVQVEDFVGTLRREPPHRVSGTAIFMTSNPRVIPPALMHHFTHNQVLHQQIILLSIVTADVPGVPMKQVLEVKDHGDGFFEVVATFGFMQAPKVERILRLLKIQAGVQTDERKTTYYLGRDVLLIDGPERMARWRKVLFAFLMRNSLTATAYYGIPPNRVVELGMQVNL